MWRRRRDSNPRTSHPVTPLAGERLRPLGHVSAGGSILFPWIVTSEFFKIFCIAIAFLNGVEII